MRETKTERREQPRVPFDEGVTLFHNGREVGNFDSLDISSGGMRLETVPVPPRSELKAIIPVLENGRPTGLLVDCYVVWRRVGETGIRFFETSAASAKALRRIVQSAQPA